MEAEVKAEAHAAHQLGPGPRDGSPKVQLQLAVFLHLRATALGTVVKSSRTGLEVNEIEEYIRRLTNGVPSCLLRW